MGRDREHEPARGLMLGYMGHGWGEKVVGGILRLRWVLMGVGLFVIVAAQVVAGGWLTRWDVGVLEWFVAHRSDGWSTAAREFTFFGNPGRATVVAAAVAVFVGWRAKDWRAAVLIGGTVAGAAFAGAMLKQVLDRSRPPADTRMTVVTNMSFPSGHAGATTALVGVVLLTYLSTRPGRLRAWGAVALGVVLVITMCLTRLYLGVHWLTDVVGGTILGGTAVAIAAVAQAHWRPRYTAVPDKGGAGHSAAREKPQARTSPNGVRGTRGDDDATNQTDGFNRR